MDKLTLYSIAAILNSNRAKRSAVKGLPLDIVSERELHRRYQDRPRSPEGGRNAKCPCGSGAKWKKCCGKVDKEEPKAPAQPQPKENTDERPVENPVVYARILRPDERGGIDRPLPDDRRRDEDAQPS